MNMGSHGQAGVRVEDCLVANATHLTFDSYSDACQYLACADKSSIAMIYGKPRESSALKGLSGTGKQIVFLDFAKQSRIIEHAANDQVITVEGGISFAELDSHLESAGQRWPVMPPDTGMSVDEIAAFNRGGPLEHRFGGPKDLILGIQVLVSSGDVIKCGGRVVKNVTGYDLTRLFVGAAGSLGLIGKCHLRLFSRPEDSLTVLFGIDSWQAALSHARRVMHSGLPLDCLEIFSTPLCPAPYMPQAKICLSVRGSGCKQVVEEIFAAVKILVDDHMPFVTLEKGLEETFWSGLARLSKPENGIEVVMSEGMIAAFLEEDLGETVRVLLRPGRSKLRLLSDNENFDMIALLRNFAHKQGQPVMVAYANEAFEYQVERLTFKDSHQERIIADIRAQLDPYGCMNPQVRV